MTLPCLPCYIMERDQLYEHSANNKKVQMKTQRENETHYKSLTLNSLSNNNISPDSSFDFVF